MFPGKCQYKTANILKFFKIFAVCFRGSKRDHSAQTADSEIASVSFSDLKLLISASRDK